MDYPIEGMDVLAYNHLSRVGLYNGWSQLGLF
jgi:hypothetical protein